VTVLDLFRLDGKVALVTGAGRGLGREMAIALAEAGADIVLLTRRDASTTAEHIRALGRRVLEIRRDVAIEAGSLPHDVDRVLEEFGRLDILVNNAGTIRRAPAATYSTEDWNEVTSVNMDAVFLLSQAAGRHMLAQGGGRIINVASLLSFQGGIFVPAYAASKHAVAGITKALANEWTLSGVTVNAIAPGYMETDNTVALRDDPDRAAAISVRIPAGRWGTPADLKGATVFLASDAAAYVSGAILPVDGGWLVR
jgi:2-dehydro-3-deoxy-D-gluconate 5-dehydrogenase